MSFRQSDNIYGDLKNNNIIWRKVFLFTFLSIDLYVFMEWLFIATKRSFLNAISFEKQLEIIFLTILIISAISAVFLFILFTLNCIPGLFKRTSFFLWIGGLFVAIILTGLLLLLVDNFTYTIFKIGVVTSRGLLRGLYCALFLVTLFVVYRWILKNLSNNPTIENNKFGQKNLYRLVFIVFVISFILLLLRANFSNLFNIISNSSNITNRPNILLIGSDGMNAGNMSVYGYKRDTTPILDDFSKDALFMENAFSNASNTTGSITSLLTGKSPAVNRVIYTPDILRGVNAYQHLPGILRENGYYAVQISLPTYGDAYDLNVQDGFDIANQRSVNEGQTFQFLRKLQLDDVNYFLSTLAERFTDRLQHIFFIREMPDPYSKVTKPAVNVEEQVKVDQVIDLFTTIDQPLFVHVHMMGTHSPQLFSPVNPIFSAGEIKGDQTRMTDFYDDAIHDFDTYMGTIINGLSDIGKLNNTIIIIYSDHAMLGRFERVPLIIRFPGGEYAGRIKNNTQNIDIAPTILDYLKLEIPSYMQGQSLLRGEPDQKRIIFSAGVDGVMVNDWQINNSIMKPPFYQYGFFNIIECQNWAQFGTVKMRWLFGEVPMHSSPCTEDNLPDKQTMQNDLIDYLKTAGFDTRTIPNTVVNP